MNHCIYIHRTADTGEIFYVGRAAISARNGKFERPYSASSRSAFWNRIAKKHGFKVEIVKTFNSKLECDIEEKRMIAFYGKREDGGILCNLANGGQGNAGANRSLEWRKKVSLAHKGKTLSKEHRQKLSVSHQGKKLTDEQKAKISEASKRHPNFKLNDPDVRARARITMLSVKRPPRTKAHQEKINLANRGQKRTEEAKLKMSIAAKTRWLNSQKN